MGNMLGTLSRAGLGLGLGALLFLIVAMRWPTAATGGVATWVADRDGNALVALDPDLFVVQKQVLRHPVRIAHAGAGLWVAAAVAGGPLGSHALFWAQAGAAPAVVSGGGALGPLLDLECAPSGGALLVEFGLAGAPARLLRTGPGGLGVGPVLHPFATHLGATAVLGVLAEGPVAGLLVEDLLVGDSKGWLTRYGPDASVLGAVSLGGQLVDLEAGPDGRVFALDAAGPGRILCLDRELHVLWAQTSGLATEHLSAVPGEERVWIADSTEPLARRYGPGGFLELEVLLPTSDVSAVRAESDRGALFSTPGAVLRVDPFGAILPGQGGFDYLTDIDSGR